MIVQADHVRGEGGMFMVDDDMGFVRGSDDYPSLGSEPRPHQGSGSARLPSAPRPPAPASRPREEFPSLQAAARVAGPSPAPTRCVSPTFADNGLICVEIFLTGLCKQERRGVDMVLRLLDRKLFGLMIRYRNI